MDFTPGVAVLDAYGKSVSATVRANATGEFAIAGLPNAPLQVRATSEEAVIVQWISPGILAFGGPASPLTLTFDQPRPQILSIVPDINNVAMRTVTPGATVTVNVSVRSSRQGFLKYDWRLLNGMGTLNSSGSIAKWTLPTQQGSYTAYLLVSDGSGGYATGSVSVMVGAAPEALAAKALSAVSGSPGVAKLSSSPLVSLAMVSPTPGKLLQLKDGSSDQNTAAAYYNKVDPQHRRTYVNGDTTKKMHLKDWWSANGFDPQGNAAGQVRTSYLNNNDLGSGRDMHFLQHPDGTVSAYVTNYLHKKGQFDQNAMSADDALNQNPAARAATVCMEWSQIEGQSGAIVKFFVYGSGSFDDPSPDQDVIQEGVDLGVGTKFVPNLCLECHGGDYVPTNSPSPAPTPTIAQLDLKASFREFDTATFKYPGGRVAPNETEKAAFKRQNFIVRGKDNDHISTTAIKQLVNGWYNWYNIRDIPVQIPVNGGVLYIDPHPASTTEDSNWNPAAWNSMSLPEKSSITPHDLYHQVVAKSCRTCHIAFTNNSTADIDWSTFDQFNHLKGTIWSYVGPDPTQTTSSRIMPHAPVTYINFWTSVPSQPAALLQFTGTTGTGTGP